MAIRLRAADRVVVSDDLEVDVAAAGGERFGLRSRQTPERLVPGRVQDDVGLLLPDLDGVPTAEAQVEIARRKAGIPDGAQVQLYRFTVRRIREAG